MLVWLLTRACVCLCLRAVCVCVSRTVFYRCIPSFNTSYTQSALSFLNSPTELFNHALGDLGTAWWVLAISAGAALVASFIWLCLLRTPCCAPIVVWMSIILIFLVAIALDFFLWFTGALPCCAA